MLNVESAHFLGIKLINLKDFLDLIIRFGFNVLIVTVIIRCIYYPLTRRKDYLFTYFLVSVITFLMCYLLENVKLELGFALGLFAVFGILRYRTDAVPIKEMTYLFIVIGISVVNALFNKKVSYSELLFTNFSVVLITFLLERVFLLKYEVFKIINYEKIDLIRPDRREELIKDLRERTGIEITRIEILRIDFLRDSVRIRIFYFEYGNFPTYSDGSGQGDDGD